MPSRSDLLPEAIGPYRITGVLGEGGMGVVYRAEQTEPVRRTVALKLIGGGADCADVAARFEAERQALAVLEHPAIADVLDAGETDEGNPYFVMEYVDGVPLSEYCDENRLTVGERLELFAEVCDAVQHAHRKGIIHRDLKPTNVLVTEQAGTPRPKVIDFGIAKAAGVKLSEKTLATEHGALMGTPAYMSPEQAEGADLDVDTRTEIYALGVMLYELLVGCVPIDPEELGFVRFLGQLLSADTTPPRPSARLAALEGAKAAAAARSTDPEALRKVLEGDLDWVAMKAIEKDRERRYETPDELAADVMRYLSDEPVVARPPSTSYRVSKFVRRNRAGVTAGLVAVAVLIISAVASVAGFVRAVRAESLAVSETERATEEATTAGAVADFLVGLFESANPSAAGRPDVTARDVLEQGLASIEEDLAGQPVVQARLLTAMADAYEGMGDPITAEGLYRRVLGIREETLGPEDPEVADALRKLLINSEQPRFAGSHPFQTDPEYREEVLVWARRAVEIRERHFASDTAAWIAAFTFEAHFLQQAGRVQEGESMFLSEIARFSEELGDDHPYVAEIRNFFGRFYLNTNRFVEGAEQLEQVLALEEAKPERDEGLIGALMNNIALAYSLAGDPERAVPLYERLLEDARRNGGSAEDNQSYFWNLASLYRDLDRHAEAAAMWSELADASSEVWGEGHQYPLTYRINAGEQRIAAGDLDPGLEVLLPALAALREAYESGEAGPETLVAFFAGYNGVAAALSSRGDDPTDELLELAGPHPKLRSEAMSSLGTILARDLRRPDNDLVPEWVSALEPHDEEALAAFRRAIDYGAAERWDDPGEWHARIRGRHHDYARALVRVGRGEDLEAFADEWVSTMRAFEGEDGPRTMEARRDLARLLWTGQPDRGLAPVESSRDAAIPLLEQVLADVERDLGDGMHLVNHLVPLRWAYEHAGRPEEAEAVAVRLRDLFEARLQELDDLAASGEPVEAARWNGNCWWASLAGMPDIALQACDAAVEGAADSERGGHHDSRGVARALAGDYDGAIADFEAYLATISPITPAARQRRAWIEVLERRENPFTPDVLGALAF